MTDHLQIEIDRINEESRLRAEEKRAELAAPPNGAKHRLSIFDGSMQAELSRLRAENERLRATLREIDKIAVGKSFGMATRMQAAARAALTEGETK